MCSVANPETSGFGPPPESAGRHEAPEEATGHFGWRGHFVGIATVSGGAHLLPVWAVRIASSRSYAAALISPYMLAFIVKLRFWRNISGSKPANVVAIQFQVPTKHERKPAIDCVARSLAPCHEAGAQASSRCGAHQQAASGRAIRGK